MSLRNRSTQKSYSLPFAIGQWKYRRLAFPSWILGWTVLLVGFGGWVQAQQIMRPTSIWGDVVVKEPGTPVGGVEVLTALLMILLVSALIEIALIFRIWRRLNSAPAAEGSEVLRVWDLNEKDQKRLTKLMFGVVPWVTVPALLLGSLRHLWGIPLPHWVIGAFWLTALLAASAFLMLEAVRRALGSPRLRRDRSP